jgi:O-antigen/teichoic acid export membrane protein
LNLGLNLLLLPRLGILGAAVASFAAYIGADLLANAEIRYFEGASPLSTTALAPAVVGLPLLAAWYWLAARFDVWLPVALGLTAALGVVYAVAFVAVAGFEDEEALVIREAQRRFDVELRLLNRFLDRFS